MKRIYLIVSRVLLILFLLTALVMEGSFYSFAQQKEPSIDIMTKKEKQTIDMIGGDMERSADALFKAKNYNDIINWSFKDIGLNVCRIKFDKIHEITEGEKNLGVYDNGIKAMKLIKSASPNVKFWATLKSDYNGYPKDPSNPENNLPDWIYDKKVDKFNVDKYAIFLADFLKYHNDASVPITYLSVSKEWDKVIDAKKTVEIIDELNVLLDKDENYKGILKPKYISPASWDITRGIKFLDDVKSNNLKSKFSGFCAHDYTDGSLAQWQSFVKKSNDLDKPAYNEETGTGSEGRTSGVENIQGVLDKYIKKTMYYKAGIQGEVFFELWSRGIKQETRSIYFPPNQLGVRKKSYYILKSFSNNVLNSKYVEQKVNNLKDNFVMTFKKSNNDLIVWVINNSNIDNNNMPININGMSIDKNKKVLRITWTSNSKDTGDINEINPTEINKLSTNIPKKSISMFRIPLK